MRLLYLTHRVPYAPNRGDRIRAYQMLRFFKARGIAVCLVALAHDDDEAAGAAQMTALAEAIHVVRVPRARNLLKASVQAWGGRPLTHVLLDSPEMHAVLGRVRDDFRPDLVLAYCSGMARFAMEPPLSTLPFVLDMVDVDSVKWESMGRDGHGPRAWIYRREARLLRRFEARATRTAAATVVVSQREAEALHEIDAAFTPVVVPNGVDVDAFRNPGPPSARPEVVFTGVFSYEPNEAGALWLLDRVWPHVLARRPDAHLTLVGMGPGDTLRRRAEVRGAEVTGAVPDVRSFLWRAAVAVAPLATARGVQNKVLEAVAAGLPAVITLAVSDGLPACVGAACHVAHDPQDFATGILRLLGLSPDERRCLASRATIETLGWDASLEPLDGVLARISA